MGYYLDGRADARPGQSHPRRRPVRLPGASQGNRYVTDWGMTGPAHSVIGIKPEQSMALFRGDLTSRFEAAPGPCKLGSVLFTIDTASALCQSVERIDLYD